MWNPKKDRIATTAHGNVEDCDCSSSSLETVKSLQTSVNAIDINTKEKETEQEEEILDSGIISGLQSNNSDIYDTSISEKKKLNTNILTESFPKQINETHCENYKIDNFKEVQIFDSGCIDDDVSTSQTAEDNFSNNDVAENENTTSTSKRNNDCLTQKTRSTVNAGSTSESKNFQMLCANNVESGMLYGFRNLSLHEVNSSPSANNSNQLLTGDTIEKNTNELRYKINDINVTNKSASSHQEHSTALSSPTLAAANNWQQFYNQDDEGNTPLHIACFWGEEDVVAALIRLTPHSYLLNIPNDAAQTPLHIATLSQQPSIMRMLLIAGAMPNLRDSNGNTPLHIACKTENEQSVQALITPITSLEVNEFQRKYRINCRNYVRLPPDLEIRNYDGENCVHLAAQSGHINILRTLVLSGADINVREGKAGHTCLHMAIQNSNEALVTFLIAECGKLDVEVPTYARLTAYQLAKCLNRVQIIQMLEKHGAELISVPETDSDYSDSDVDSEEDLLSNQFGDPGYFVNFQGPSNAMSVA